MKLDNGRDFKLGVVTDTSEAPRVRVRTLTNGRQHEPLIHPLTLGLLFRDPPSQSSNEVEAENEARQRAEDGLKKTWQGQPANKISTERRKLVEFHENQIMAGLHRGRINLSTGLTEPYLIIDLPKSDEIQKDDAFVPHSIDPDSLQQLYQCIKAITF